MEDAISKKVCLRCDHVWYPRNPERPYVCPKCKSARWDIEARPYRVKEIEQGALNADQL